MSPCLIIEVHWESFLNNFGKLIKLTGQFVNFQIKINSIFVIQEQLNPYF